MDGATVAHQATAYMIVLEFAAGNRLVIDQERAMQFGQRLDRLHLQLKDLYRH